jgi:cell division protein ZapA
MARRMVDLRVAGRTYRVVSSASESELVELAGDVEARVAEMPAKDRSAPQAMVLAALALAHELRTERAQRQKVEARARELLKRVVGRIDDVLRPQDGDAVAGDEE